MENLRTNQQRAKNAITLIWVVLVLEIVYLISNYMQYDLLQTVADGNMISMEAAEANDTRVSVVAYIYIIASIVSAVTFIQWFRRAYYNLRQKAGKRIEFTDGWAAGCWFVPILNLFRPYQIMKELYQETKRLFTNNEIKINEPITTNLLGWWWTLWLIHNFVCNIVARYYLKNETLSGLQNATMLDMISNILGIILAIVTISVIKNYANVEHLLKEIPSPDKENQIRLNGQKEW